MQQQTTIKQSVINTFNRVGIDYLPLLGNSHKIQVANRFSGEPCDTSPLIARLIKWVYDTSNDYENGIQKVNISDFDRIRYYIAEADSKAYMTCID